MIALTTILCMLVGGMIGCALAERGHELPFAIFIPIGLVCGAIIGFILGVTLSRRYYNGAELATILGALVGATLGHFIAYRIAVLRGVGKDEVAAVAGLYGVPIGVACGAIIGFIVGVRL